MVRTKIWFYSGRSASLAHHFIALASISFNIFFFLFLYKGQSKLNFPSLPSSPSLSPLILGHIFRPHLCRALALFGARASFILNDGFLYWERIQDLPIKWWRYIIGLIRQSYYEPAGARCHQSGWKSISLDSDPSGLNNAAFHFNIISAPTIKRLYIHAVTLLFS